MLILLVLYTVVQKMSTFLFYCIVCTNIDQFAYTYSAVLCQVLKFYT